MMVNYGFISAAVAHYRSYGFEPIDAPWLVSKKIAEITKPADRPHYLIRREGSDMEKSFVASGEQSFLYLINKGHLPGYGKFQTVTPCIRPDTFDSYHTKYFMKNELIWYNVKGIANYGQPWLDEMLRLSMTLFSNLVGSNYYDKLKVVQQSEHSYDIELDGVEIGSYGFRSTDFVSWVYGTGIAEPRFSSVYNSLVLKEYNSG